MGIVSQLSAGQVKSISLNSGLGTPQKFPGSGEGAALWRRTFGAVTKEDGSTFPRVRQPYAGGSWGRGMLSEPASYKRLLEAMRSMAPGGWSDNRWEQSKHLTGLNFVAITRIGMQLSQAEFSVLKQIGPGPDDVREVTPKDPAEGGREATPYDLVKILKVPNNQDSFGKLMWRSYQQKALTGTALNWMVPNKFGDPYELYTIPTAIAIPQPAINPDYPDGYWRIQPLYPYGPFSSYPTPATAVGAPIPAQWMLRWGYPHPLLRYDGYSPLTGLRLEMDEFDMIGRSRHYSMRKSFNPSAILNLTEVEGMQQWIEAEIDRVRAEMENVHQGPENHGTLFVSPPGGTIEQYGSNPDEMDYPNSWKQLADFILGGGFGISSPAAGMTETSNYATLFAQLKQLYMVTLEPECDDFASGFTRHLAPFFGDDLIVKIKCKRIDDHELLLNKLNAAAQQKVITKNQYIKLLDLHGLTPTKEAWGGDICGDPSPMEKEAQQGAQGAMPGQMAAAEAGPETTQLAAQNGTPPAGQPSQEQQPIPDDASIEEMLGIVPEDTEAEQSRYGPGDLGKGSLGPRKSMKSLYSDIRKGLKKSNKNLHSRNGEILLNGHQ